MAASASETSMSEVDLARCSTAAADEQLPAVVICFHCGERNHEALQE
jgi:hypothetical protein